MRARLPIISAPRRCRIIWGSLNFSKKAGVGFDFRVVQVLINEPYYPIKTHSGVVADAFSSGS